MKYSDFSDLLHTYEHAYKKLQDEKKAFFENSLRWRREINKKLASLCEKLERLNNPLPNYQQAYQTYEQNKSFLEEKESKPKKVGFWRNLVLSGLIFSFLTFSCSKKVSEIEEPKEAKEELTILQGELAEKQARIAELEAEVSGYKQKVTQQNSLLRKYDQSLKRKASLLEESKSEGERYKKEVTELKIKLETLQEQLESKEKQISDLERKLKEKRKNLQPIELIKPTKSKETKEKGFLRKYWKELLISTALIGVAYYFITQASEEKRLGVGYNLKF